MMKKMDKFTNCLNILKNADFAFANENEIYRSGVLWQFNLVFRLAWKALQAVLKLDGANGADARSPRAILQLGYKLGFIENFTIWLTMQKKRNTLAHLCDEDKINEMLLLIRDSFTPAFVALEATLRSRLANVEEYGEE